MPLFNRVCGYERTTDKGEVGGSSPPRPTIHLNRSKNSRVCLSPIKTAFQSFDNYSTVFNNITPLMFTSLKKAKIVSVTNTTTDTTFFLCYYEYEKY